MPLETAFEVFSRRLETNSEAPLAVAVSGGGDSIALLALAADWGKRHGRRLLVLHVDHGLNPQSPLWAQGVERAAKETGADFRRLAWIGLKPASGLPAAARIARHALLADAAREAGARVILLAHTNDDLVETALMRQAGSSLGAPREWSPSPAWPEGRGVFLLRPLLGVGRAALRDYLKGQGLSWIEDPANSDPHFARSRARAAQRDAGAAAPPPALEPKGGAQDVWREVAGGLVIDRAALRARPAAEIAAACLCAAGTTMPPRGERLKRLIIRLQGREVFSATLSGARIEATEDQVLFAREAGEAARGGLAPLSLQAGESGVWDGRYTVRIDHPTTVWALGGLAAKLDKPSKAALRAIPAALRPSLPAVVGEDGQVRLPSLTEAESLTLPRLLAFAGTRDHERALTPSR